MRMRSAFGERSAQHFLKAGPVDSWPKPIRAHILGRGQMVLPRVLHGKGFCKRPAEACVKPVRIVLHRPLWCLPVLHEIGDDLDDQIVWQSVQMELHWMQRP